MEGMFLINEGGSNAYFRDAFSRCYGLPILTSSNDPNLHSASKRLILQSTKDGYKLSNCDKRLISNIVVKVINGLNDYTNMDYNFAVMITDVKLMYSLPVLFIINPKEREIISMYTVMENNKGQVIFRLIGINTSLEDAKITKYMNDIANGLNKVFS